jgi:hypothetical protein
MLKKNAMIYCVTFSVLALVIVCSVYFYYQSAAYEATKEIACVHMSSVGVVEQTISEHKDVILEIEKLGGSVSITPTFTNPKGCAGAAFVVIYYSTNAQRKEIKKMIGDQFFGHPYRMINM